MDQILVVFYSYTGTSRRLAQLLCAQLDWPSGEIVERQSRAGGSGTVRCILDTLLRRRPAIRYDGPDPAGYDAVVLVSPIWAYGLAGPMRSFVGEQRAKLRNVAVISVMGSAGASNAVAEIDRLSGRAPLIAAAFTSREVLDGSCARSLQAFGRALQQASPGAAAIAGDKWSPRGA
ncbi:flavodoxin [Ramlibacter sp.]|uniref:flavodoxin family protein n=1 Tax=Ramlibacter sp. TaxID=1917967 RepID=UPI002C91DAEF|nr:flavodoxin [Ramlibacter sp.]HWI81125.1 flavodoxin [Ramlibacter sp.]